MLDKRNAKIASIIGILGLLLTVSGYVLFVPVDTVYEYEIKAEQVYDNDRVDKSVQVDQLSGSEKQLLYRAFKKSDHFFGQSSTIIHHDTKLNTLDGWQLIEYQGVYMLVAVSGPEKELNLSSFGGFITLLLLVFFVVLTTFGLLDYSVQ